MYEPTFTVTTFFLLHKLLNYYFSRLQLPPKVFSHLYASQLYTTRNFL